MNFNGLLNLKTVHNVSFACSNSLHEEMEKSSRPVSTQV